MDPPRSCWRWKTASACNRLIDPETTPSDSFLRAITDLQRAIGISDPGFLLGHMRLGAMPGHGANLAGRGPPESRP